MLALYLLRCGITYRVLAAAGLNILREWPKSLFTKWILCEFLNAQATSAPTVSRLFLVTTTIPQCKASKFRRVRNRETRYKAGASTFTSSRSRGVGFSRSPQIGTPSGTMKFEKGSKTETLGAPMCREFIAIGAGYYSILVEIHWQQRGY